MKSKKITIIAASAIADYKAVLAETDDGGLRTEATQRLKVLEEK